MMDWENKFASIVRETESNLDKVKKRLGSARTASTFALQLNDSSNHHDRSYMSELNVPNSSLVTKTNMHSSWAGFPNSSPVLNNTTSKVGLPDTYHSPSAFDLRGNDNHAEPLSLDQSPGVVLLLQDKVDSQARAIEMLTRSMKRMEEERQHTYKQMRELRQDLALLNSRVCEKGVDLQTERKMEQWRREMFGEMQLLQSQLQLQKSRVDESNLYSADSPGVMREVHDVRRSLQEDCDSVRRDMESVKSRMAKIELDMSTVSTDSRDLGRLHDKLERRYDDMSFSEDEELNVRDLKDSQNDIARDWTRTNADHRIEQKEITDLRSSLRQLRDKIENLDDQIHSGDQIKNRPKRPGKRKSPKKTKEKPYSPADLLSPNTSDLELSSTSFVDLDDSDASPSRQVALTTENSDLEDELDLDDFDPTTGDLTTDDTFGINGIK